MLSSNDISEIKRLLREIVLKSNNNTIAGGQQVFSGTVKSVEGTSCTLTIDSLDLPDVRLRATLNDSNDELLITPKVGSYALAMTVTGNLDDLMIIKCDQIEKIEFKQSGLQVVIDSTDGKVSVKNNSVSLLDLYDAVFDIITNLKVTTPSGPSTGLLPDTVTSLTQFKTKYKQLLK